MQFAAARHGVQLNVSKRSSEILGPWAAALAALLLCAKAPGAQMITSITFVAILMTILIQALTTEWLRRRLGLWKRKPGRSCLK
jgi:NhaP-type Na+/H+ or K+/H+ antiporter